MSLFDDDIAKKIQSEMMQAREAAALKYVGRFKAESLSWASNNDGSRYELRHGPNILAVVALRSCPAGYEVETQLMEEPSKTEGDFCDMCIRRPTCLAVPFKENVIFLRLCSECAFLVVRVRNDKSFAIAFDE